MEDVNYKSTKWSGILLFAGGVTFWTGAVCPPYKQWATNDIKEYLAIINAYSLNWYIIHGLFLVGIFLCLCGMQLLASLVRGMGGRQGFAIIASNTFLLGTIFWILNITFRLTVTVSVAEDVAATNVLPYWFQTAMDWSNLVFAVFMTVSYFGIGCLGCALRKIKFFPTWVSLFCIYFGFTGTVLYLSGFPLFAPPLMVYLPIILTGTGIVTRLRKSQYK